MNDDISMYLNVTEVIYHNILLYLLQKVVSTYSTSNTLDNIDTHCIGVVIQKYISKRLTILY